MINGPEPEVPGDIDMSGPYNLYMEALELSAGHAGANFGAGILEVMMLTQDPQVQDFYDKVKAFVDDGSFFEVESEQSAFAGSMAMCGPVFKLDQVHIPLMQPLKVTRAFSALPADGDPTIDELQGMCLNEILPRVNTCVQRLTKVTETGDFVFIVTPKMQGDVHEDPLEIDLTEVYATLAGLNAVRAGLLHFTAYDFNLDEYTGAEMLAALAPGSSFGTLHAEGSSRMASALGFWRQAVDDLEEALDFLEAETDPQGDDVIRIDPYDELTQANVDSIRYYLPKVRNLLNSSETFTADWDGRSSTPREGLEFSLSSFFMSPIQDFKALLPSYTVSLDTSRTYSWKWEETQAVAVVDIAVAGYYYWQRYASYSNGELYYFWENTTIDVPEWEGAWNSIAQKAADSPWGYVNVYWSSYLEPGQHTISCVMYLEYEELESARYVPRITWEANSFEEWVLPDPTLGGLLPGMTDQRFKETFGLDADDWAKEGTLELW
jgi:hypothetical protein